MVLDATTILVNEMKASLNSPSTFIAFWYSALKAVSLSKPSRVVLSFTVVVHWKRLLSCVLWHWRSHIVPYSFDPKTDTMNSTVPHVSTIHVLFLYYSFLTQCSGLLASQVVAIVINEKLTVLEQLFKKKNSQDLITVTGKWKVKTHWNILSCQWWKNKRGYCSDASWFVWLISGFLFLLHISNWWSICTKERSLTFEHVGKLSWSKSSYFMPNYMYQDAIQFQLGIAKQTCLYYTSSTIHGNVYHFL